MAKQRYINTRLWADSWVADLDPVEKLLFIYLLTNEHTEICGIYELPIKYMSLETGIEKEMIEKILGRFEKDEKVNYFKGWIFIKNFVKNQMTSSPKVKTGIELSLKKVPISILEEFDFPKNILSIVGIKPTMKMTRRQSVYIRDRGVCQYCGKEIKKDSDVEIDHIIPASRNGTESYENLILSCRKCNQEKLDKTALEYCGKNIKGRIYHTEKAVSELLEDKDLLNKVSYIYPTLVKSTISHSDSDSDSNPNPKSSVFSRKGKIANPHSKQIQKGRDELFKKLGWEK